ncbi:MAG: Dabb family protein [Deltaproteobacteria bacterium]|nr:Dabb family protein [Deltaproteobacteria bacterium]
MITHIALIKLIHVNAETIELAREMLSGMEGKIPECRQLEVGVNLVQSYRSYDLSLVVRFDSLEGFQAYQNHPAHVEVVKNLQGLRQSTITVDYETL